MIYCRINTPCLIALTYLSLLPRTVPQKILWSLWRVLEGSGKSLDRFWRDSGEILRRVWGESGEILERVWQKSSMQNSLGWVRQKFSESLWYEIFLILIFFSFFSYVNFFEGKQVFGGSSNSTACHGHHQNRKDDPPIGRGKEMSQANQSMRWFFRDSNSVDRYRHSEIVLKKMSVTY